VTICASWLWDCSGYTGLASELTSKFQTEECCITRSEAAVSFIVSGAVFDLLRSTDVQRSAISSGKEQPKRPMLRCAKAGRAGKDGVHRLDLCVGHRSILRQGNGGCVAGWAVRHFASPAAPLLQTRNVLRTRKKAILGLTERGDVSG
jgi:hypothetical protein